jgi:hypothetical protein
MEQVLLDSWLRDRKDSPVRIEDSEDVGNEEVMTQLMKCAALLFKDDKQGEGTYIVNYSDRTSPWELPSSFSSAFWEEIMPKNKGKVKVTPVQFWTEERVDHFFGLLSTWGWNRWDKFEAFGRTNLEIMKLSAVFIKKLLGDSKEYPMLSEIGAGYASPEFRKFSTSIPTVLKKIETVDGPTFLRRVECLLVITKLKPQSIEDISVDHQLPPLKENWSSADDKTLLLECYRSGLGHRPPDFHPELSDEDLLERTLVVLTRLKTYRPTVIMLRTPKKITVNDHQHILATIMSYGYPSAEEFRDHLDVQINSVDVVKRYCENVFLFCESSLEERKRIAGLLADKVPKYTAQKIPQRRLLFERIRECATRFNEFAAEDIEFLTAVASHGMAHTSMSPILNVLCLGVCTETKIYLRIKALFSERHHNHVTQRIPPNITEKMPLRINDMHMLLSLGQIDGRKGFHNALYIYPIGYSCAVVCPSPSNRESLIWMECFVEEKDDNPLFIVKPYKSETFRFIGPTPNAPFEELRGILAKKRKIVPPIDGHEMFGFTTAFVHRLLMEMPGFELCLSYNRRFFRSNFAFVSEWPTIGRFETNPEKLLQNQNLSGANSARFRFKKKAFGDVLPPLVLNFSCLFAGDERNSIINVRGGDIRLSELVDRYRKWDEGVIAELVSQSEHV